MAPEESKFIEIKDLYKVYRVGSEKIHALDGISLTIEEGEFCAVVGTSGSGKSTLLNMLAGLEPPTKGSIKIGGREIVGLKENQLVAFRREHVGFIFQSFNLIPTMTAKENVALPLTFQGVPKVQRNKRALALLKLTGLYDHRNHKPNQLSGGQQQRVGISRALVVEPEIIFADEPTGNLDSATSAEILTMMRRISREKNQTIITVTHDDHLARFADRIIRILHEIHAPLVEMKKLAKHGYKNYDFLLSSAILEALLVDDASLIVELLSDSDRPTNWVTLIDCHDGIPVQPDMNGVLDKDRMVETINKTEENGAIFSALHSVEKAYEDAPNVHQICGALYSLLGEDDDAFVSARAIQLFAPGTPQIYYEGLLGGTHCREGYERTKDGRELNRRNYSREEVAEAVKRPRAQRILNLIRYRKDRKFYEGDFSLATEGGKLMMTWQKDGTTQLEVDLNSGRSRVIETDGDLERVIEL